MPFNTKTTPGRGTSLRRRISPANNSAPDRRDALREQGRPGSTAREMSPKDPATPQTPAATTPVQQQASSNSGDWLGTPNARPLGLVGGPNSFPTTSAVPSDGNFRDTFERQYMAIRARRPNENQHEWLRRVSELDDMYKEFNSIGSWQDQQRWLMTTWDKFRERPGVGPNTDTSWRGNRDPSPADRVRDNISAMLGDDTQPSIRRSTGSAGPRLRALNERGR